MPLPINNMLFYKIVPLFALCNLSNLCFNIRIQSVHLILCRLQAIRLHADKKI